MRTSLETVVETLGVGVVASVHDYIVRPRCQHSLVLLLGFGPWPVGIGLGTRTNQTEASCSSTSRKVFGKW